MNVSDLATELQRQAEELDHYPAQLPRIHARIRRTRRRRAAVAGVGAALALSTITATFGGLLSPHNNKPDPVTQASPIFPDQIPGYRLVTVLRGEQGKNRLRLTLPQAPRGVRISGLCQTYSRDLDTHLVVNGVGVGGFGCGGDPSFVQSAAEFGFTEEWDLVPNGVDVQRRPFVVTLRLLRGEYNSVPTTDPSTTLWMAIYAPDQESR